LQILSPLTVMLPLPGRRGLLPGRRLEDSLSFYDFPEVDRKRISSTNDQERLSLEIGRRNRVVRRDPFGPRLPPIDNLLSLCAIGKRHGMIDRESRE